MLRPFPRRSRQLPFVVVPLVLVAGSLAAQTWTFRNLHPAGAENSALTAVTATAQAGNVSIGGESRAGLWTGTAESFVNLHPSGFSISSVAAAAGSQQVGTVYEAGGRRAYLWNGSATAGVNLHPATAQSSAAEAVTATYQAGHIYVGGFARARLWRGAAADFVDLHPAIAAASQIFAAAGDQQGGRILYGNLNRAALWRGTAASYVDLHPAGAIDSGVVAMSARRQGGSRTTIDGVTRAALWGGTAESFVDLHPDGATVSQVVGVEDVAQVGGVNFGNRVGAAYWRGTKASYRNLGAVLPGNYSGSYARAIAVAGDQVFVGGSATNQTTNRSEAILWIGTFHPPTVTVRGARRVTTTATSVTLRGVAADRDDDLARVEVKIGRAGFRRAIGTRRWRVRAALPAGVTRILVRAVDETDRRSPAASVTITRQP